LKSRKAHGRSEANRLFIEAEPICLELKNRLRGFAFVQDAKTREDIPREMTEENKENIIWYIEVISHLSDLQLELSRFQEAKPNILEILQLAKYLGDTTGNDLFNLAVIYQEEYKQSKDEALLRQSSTYYIRALLQYRVHA